MPSGNRRLPRTLRSSPPSIIGLGNEINSSRYPSLNPTVPVLEQATAPKHLPFPNTPVDDDIFFETGMLIFTVLSGGLQYLHLYRTVWWLPHSYTRHTMNFYLIDRNVVAFIVILLSRRLIYVSGCRILDRFIQPKYLSVACTCLKIFLLITLLGILTRCSYFIIQNHPFVNLLYLCYPILVYFIFFGCNVSQFFEWVTWNSPTLPPLHACRTTATEVRQEVENLRHNFNNRLIQILFNSVINAYYAGFIPCCFAQNHLHYDSYWASQHVFFIFVSTFTASSSHILSLRYCDILHRSALHLGTWSKLETRNMLLVSNNWNEETLWPYGALVKHGRDLYRAQGECNASEPGNGQYNRFYYLFRNPSQLICFLTLTHVLMVGIQLGLLFSISIWHNTISITFMLFFNYYVMYNLGRDCLVSIKMYNK